jgi:pimeloyl-ACP methyl ester carboxylesterase
MTRTTTFDRRSFLRKAAVTIAAAQVALPSLAHAQPNTVSRGTAMTATTSFAAPTIQSDSTAVRPFSVSTSDDELADLRSRLAATKWPDRETVSDDSQGVQLATIQNLAQYWRAGYDWRACEARLNALPQFVTEIDGLDIHFVHVRANRDDALPVIVTHGWPGSFIEQLKIIDPLTNPTAHGASASDAFHVVVPSMPGYGFSAKPTEAGWDPTRIARAWVTLMKRLGYTRFVAQGGDWGALITNVMGRQAAPELLGIHTNLPGTVPAELAPMLASGSPAPADLGHDEKRAYEQLSDLYARHVAYSRYMGLRPQTLYGIADSPVGLAAWMLDHDVYSYHLIADAFAGAAGGLTPEDVLDNMTLYWLTNTGVSSARLYWENKLSILGAADVSIPAGVSVFPDEIYEAPRSWAEEAYHNLIYFNQVEAGGHFAAWEQPALFSRELRAAFRSLR